LKKTKFVLEVIVKSMEVGQNGHLGLVVEVTVRCQDLEVAQIPLLSMEVLTVLASMKKTNLAQEEDARSMEVGQVGNPGLFVEVLVRCGGLEVVIIHLLKMMDLIAMVTTWKTKFVLEANARLMEVGQLGHLGLVVEEIVRCQDLEVVIIQLLKMEVLTV